MVDDDNKYDVDGQGDDNDDVDGEADDHVDGEGGEPSADGDSSLALVKCEPHAGDKSKPCEASYFVGWHDQQEAAWRAPATNPSAYEYTKDVRPGDSDMAPCVAHWPDGFRHELSDFTTVSWQTRQQAASKGKRQTSHFVGTLRGKKLKVRDMVERGLLASAFLGKKQILQTPVGTTSHERAIEIVTTAAKEVCDGKTKIDDLYARRAQLMTADELDAQKVMKKPTTNQASMKATASADGVGTRPDDDDDEDVDDDSDEDRNGGIDGSLVPATQFSKRAISFMRGPERSRFDAGPPP